MSAPLLFGASQVTVTELCAVAVASGGPGVAGASGTTGVGGVETDAESGEASLSPAAFVAVTV